MTNRRLFIKKASGSVALSLLGTGLAQADASTTPVAPAEDTFRQGIAGYSFVHFKLDESLAMMRKTNIQYLCIKDFHYSTLLFLGSDNEIVAFLPIETGT